MIIKVKAYAKINLLLDIVSTRTDGYHDLFMIMQSVGIYDTVTVEKTKGNKITLSCNIDGIPLDEHNIAHKAATAFFNVQGIKKNKGVHIDIQKRIPHAAGLAGGSADGAAVIVALNEMFNTGLSQKELCKIGVKVGAYLPFCITGGTLLAQGIGDCLCNVKPLKKCFVLLAKSDYSVNTGKAYSEFDKVSEPGEDILQAKEQIENTLDTINDAFSELLNNLFQDRVFDVTTDAQVLQTMLSRDGLVKDEI